MSVIKRNAAGFLFLFVCLTWGTTWMAMKLAVDTIPPLQATGLRFLIAAPFLIVLAKFYKAPLLFPAGKRWLMGIVSIFYFAIPFFLWRKIYCLWHCCHYFCQYADCRVNRVSIAA